MKKDEAMNRLKSSIRANACLLELWKDGDISYGVMAEKLSASIMRTIEEDIKMIAPVDPTTAGIDNGSVFGSGGICQWEHDETE